MSGKSIVVTGGAGFIGSCLVGRLNRLGEKRVLVVDEDFDAPLKRRNVQGKSVLGLEHKDAFLKRVQGGDLPGDLRAVFHMGACSSTTEGDWDYLRRNNTDYTRVLYEWCAAHQVPFIYASSGATYGDGAQGYSDDPKKLESLSPLNLYGRSKQDFDLWLARQGKLDTALGFKFFNVFGPNEQHKGDMQSLVSKAYAQIMETGRLKLFKSHHPDWKDGESVRDFIYVMDVLDVLMHALEHPFTGLYNLGTGRARSWNDLARAVFAALGREPAVDYVDMPPALRGKYQYHTQADMGRLFAAAGPFQFQSLEQSVADYVQNYLVPGRVY